MATAVTQYAEEELRNPVFEQTHQPSDFLSTPFRAGQENWFTYEMKVYEIVQKLRRVNNLLGFPQRVTIRTNHRNLLFSFHPTAVERSLERIKLLKATRLVLYLSAFT